MTGAILYWTAPVVAKRDCRSCQLWQYNEQTGFIETIGGKPIKRRGKLPCEYATCAKGTYRIQSSWLACNAKAFKHWQECRAVGQFPDDPLVRQHAAILSEIERAVDERKERNMFAALAKSIG